MASSSESQQNAAAQQYLPLMAYLHPGARLRLNNQQRGRTTTTAHSQAGGQSPASTSNADKYPHSHSSSKDTDTDTGTVTNTALARIITNSASILSVLEHNVASTEKLKIALLEKEERITETLTRVSETVASVREILGKTDDKLDRFGGYIPLRPRFSSLPTLS